jgi:hypothetical protein
MMNYYQQVQEACEIFGIECQILTGIEAQKIHEAVEKIYFISDDSDERWTKRSLALTYETAGGTSEVWKDLWHLTKDDSIYLMFDYDLDSSVVLIKDGSKISDILRETTGFIFYIADVGLNYLIFQNFHDVLFGLGEKATSWIRSFDFSYDPIDIEDLLKRCT